MKKKESIFDEKAIQHFYKDVLYQLLPNARHQSVGFFGHAEATRAGTINLDLAVTNDVNLNSPYYYTKPYSFIHFTTVRALINILKSKSLRLYNLHGMDDKLEFTIPLYTNGKKLSSYAIKEIKKKIFCFSMCEIALEEKKRSLTAWREYGDKGNGVALVLKMEEKYKNDWVYFMLSKVYYTKTSLQKFQLLRTLYNEFSKKYQLKISTFDELLYKYFAFHKHSIYKDEREVRLLYCQGTSYFDNPPVHHDINRRNEKTSYIELPLEWEWDKNTKEYIISQGITPKIIRPVISIEKIILGYRISNEAKYEIEDVVRELTKAYSTKPRIVNSKLQEQF